MRNKKLLTVIVMIGIITVATLIYFGILGKHEYAITVTAGEQSFLVNSPVTIEGTATDNGELVVSDSINLSYSGSCGSGSSTPTITNGTYTTGAITGLTGSEGICNVTASYKGATAYVNFLVYSNTGNGSYTEPSIPEVPSSIP